MSVRLRTIASATLLLSQLLPALPAAAAVFTDVSASHQYAVEIETLASRGIVTGNPDGSFSPDKAVNRAEMLVLLYRAAGNQPAAAFTACFTDSGVNEWYSAYVCDAAKKSYVGGYPDGAFRPAQSVNRVEALKMLHTVLGITTSARDSTAPLAGFTDVALDAWYAPYMASAFAHDILPIEGQTGSRFYPDRALTKGEAAAYIFNALGLEPESSTSSSSSSSTGRRLSASSSESTAIPPKSVDFPFEDDGTFNAKRSQVYTFSMQRPVVAWIQAELAPGHESDTVRCRLYKLDEETSFAYEYYVGQMIGDRCFMRVAIGSGDYQLEVSPGTTGNLAYSLETRIVSGDGNDGFREAYLLKRDVAKTGNLEADDYAEWYRFTIDATTTRTVTLSNAHNLSCLIYPMGDVDLYGFSGPVCNEVYEMPAGTYYVGVMKRDGRDDATSFTINLE